eukprot:1227414-Pleurochrysis_carterae.AAC.1
MRFRVQDHVQSARPSYARSRALLAPDFSHFTSSYCIASSPLPRAMFYTSTLQAMRTIAYNDVFEAGKIMGRSDIQHH